MIMLHLTQTLPETHVFVFLLMNLVFGFYVPQAAAQEFPRASMPIESAGDSADDKKTIQAPPVPNPNAPYANPPQLQEFLFDDFSTNTRNNYEILEGKEATEWNSGVVTLTNGSQLSRILQAENWVELELDIQFPDLSNRGDKSSLKILLELEPQNDVFLELSQKQRRGQVISEYTLFENQIDLFGKVPKQSLLSLPQKNRSQNLEKLLPNGKWRVAYRQGVWQVTPPDGSKPWMASRRIGNAQIVGFHLICDGLPIRLRGLRVKLHSSAHARLTDEQRAQLHKGAQLAKDIAKQWNSSQPENTLAMAEEAYHIQAEFLGQYHFDSIWSLSTLATHYSANNQYSASERLFHQHLADLQTLAGNRHPDYAAGQCNLAFLYEKMNRYDDAVELYGEALQTYAELFGKTDDNYLETLKRLADLTFRVGNYPMAEVFYAEALPLSGLRHGKTSREYILALNSLALTTAATRNYEKSSSLYSEAIFLCERTLGRECREYASLTANLAELNREMGNFTTAKALHSQAMKIREIVVGPAHADYANSLNNLGGINFALGRFSEAERLFAQSLDINRVSPSLELVNTLNNLALTYAELGEFERAERLYAEAIDLTKTLFGEKHIEHAKSLASSAGHFVRMGDHARAATRFRQAIESWNAHPDADLHLSYTICLHNLARFYHELGDLGKAVPLLQRVIELQKEILDGDHADLATSYSSLADMYDSMGDVSRAREHYSRALQVLETVVGNRHVRYGICLHNLAKLEAADGDLAKSEALYSETLIIFENAYGRRHPEVATVLSNLADVCAETKQAISLLRESLEIRAETLGKSHPDFAIGLHQLAYQLHSVGDLDEARLLYEESVKLLAQIYGEQHPDYAAALHSLAGLNAQLGDAVRAVTLFRKSFEISLEYLESTSRIQSELQQLQMTSKIRSRFIDYVSLVAREQLNPAEAFAISLRLKGAVFSRQNALRRSLQISDSTVRNKHDELKLVTSRLTAMTMSVPKDGSGLPSWRKMYQELVATRERLEQELSHSAPEWQHRQTANGYSFEALMSKMPPSLALVDIQEYRTKVSNESGPDGSQTVLAYGALIAVPNQPTTFVELGRKEEIDHLISAWRTGFGESTTSAELPGEKLRELIWRPISETLQGVQTILISPEGAINSLPLAALPGNEAGSYLVDEYTFVVIPFFQDLLKQQEVQLAERSVSPSLLLVGGVDFDNESNTNASVAVEDKTYAEEQRNDLSSVQLGQALADIGSIPKRSVVGREAFGTFSTLPGTLPEIQRIRESFGLAFRSVSNASIDVLTGTNASKSRFQKLAPKYRYLHLATHGFFTPESFHSAFQTSNRERPMPVHIGNGLDIGIGAHPGLLSGLVFAGANRASTPPMGDRGILSASEVSEMDLTGVDLAVLSACETGMGQIAGGEGVFGLQRAFQISGASTTLTSLWRVDDQATRVLMSRFYDNLWVKKMSKAEALREAQRWMRSHPTEVRIEINKLRGGEDEQDVLTEQTYESPRYWAAGVLSGEWR
ncbi:MAG: CHAT domain-containing protein [Planctomycetaceae bacterium]|nr:CHAT domain-containing protein [Planctomycetaceae bacterium]